VPGTSTTTTATSTTTPTSTTTTTLPPLPIDPALVATPLAPFTDFRSATAFLYAGPDPIQPDVAAGAIDALRAAVVRGRVGDGDGDPLPAVRVDVLGHPEYGHMLTRADGAFDLAVNGGGPVTLRYDRPGFIGAQRQVDVPWQRYRVVPDVLLVPPPEPGLAWTDSPPPCPSPLIGPPVKGTLCQ
jgi:hypothetical protein